MKGDVPEKDDINGKIMQFQMLQSRLQAMQQKEQEIVEKIEELNRTKSGFEDLKSVKSADSFIPVGSGNFIAGKVTDTSKVIVSIGGGVAVRKSLDGAASVVEEKLKLFGDMLKNLERDGTGVYSQLMKLQQEIEKMQRQ